MHSPTHKANSLQATSNALPSYTNTHKIHMFCTLTPYVPYRITGIDDDDYYYYDLYIQTQ